MDNSQENFEKFFDQQAAGNVPYNKHFYVLDGPVQDGGAATVKLVTPTEQTVEQAKSELKETINKVAQERRRPQSNLKRHQHKRRNRTKQRGRGNAGRNRIKKKAHSKKARKLKKTARCR